jgi:DNA-binding MarR family transcriptional regulator
MPEHGVEQSETAKLLEALSYLCSKQRTGKILIREETRAGEVFLVNGKITHAQFGPCTGFPALCFILAWERGAFQFTPKEITDFRTIEMETESVLSLLNEREREWKVLNAQTPLNLDTVLTLLPQDSGSIRFKKDQWDLLARLDGKKSLRQICDEMFLTPLDLSKAIKRFREAGLIGEDVSGGTRSAVLGNDFFAALERELHMAIGPMAPIVLDEALAELKEKKTSFTANRIESLLGRLSEAITDEKKQSRFQETVRALLADFSNKKEAGAAAEK